MLKLSLIFSFSLLLVLSRGGENNGIHNREGKQGFFQWLFGPPVRADNETFAKSTFHPLIHHQLNRHQNTSVSTETFSENQSSDKLERTQISAYSPASNSSQHFNDSHNLPKPRHLRSEPRQIEITDIQHAIGTEINEPQNGDPSQVNLQQDLEAIDRFEKNLTENNWRSKREAKEENAKSTKFRQLNIPYGGDLNSNYGLSKRQLLLSPVEQQMLALNQQQNMAAAAMLQQQQQQQLLYNRYNRYIDDYYDDDSSYEDSDEYFDNFNRFGLMNRVVGPGGAMLPPTIPHPYGIGRRSLPDEAGSDERGTSSVFGPPPTRPEKKGDATKGRISSLGPISRAGRWDTIEDYDLSSDFNKLPGRIGIHLGEGHKGSDDMNHGNAAEDLFGENGRSALGRDVEKNSTSSASSPAPSTLAANPNTNPPASSSTNNTTTTSENNYTSGESSSTSSSSSNSTATSTSASPEQDNPDGMPSTTLSTDSEESQTTSTISGDSTSTVSTTDKTLSTQTTQDPVELPPPYHQTLNCRCGMQSIRGHEIGDGTIVRTPVNPWLVAVRSKQKHLCSGSIINNKYILTSKSCVHGIKGLIVTAGLGSGAPRNFSVIRTNSHSTKNIALLKIKPAIAPNYAMRPICLPIGAKWEEKTPATGTLVTFKRNFPKSSFGLQLVQTEVPMLSSSKCSRTPGSGSSSSFTLCPGPPGSMKCGGDTGGILQLYQKGYSYQQIGLVATSVGCRANKTPGVYTDIRKSLKWILYNTGDAKYCRKPKVTAQDLTNSMKTSNSKKPSQEEVELYDESEQDEEDAIEIGEEGEKYS